MMVGRSSSQSGSTSIKEMAKGTRGYGFQSSGMRRPKRDNISATSFSLCQDNRGYGQREWETHILPRRFAGVHSEHLEEEI